jgi:hypothetical protein
MRTFTRNFLKAVACVPALAAAWYFLGQWWAPGGCLDFGGSFNYVTWQCSHTLNYPYIDVPVYRFGSFWLFVVCLIFAVAAVAGHRSRPNAA